MDKEKKKFLDKVKNWTKVGVMAVGIAAFGMGDKTVDAHQIPNTNSSQQVDTIQNQREAFDKSIRVETKSKTEKVNNEIERIKNRENVKDRISKEQIPLPNIPFASNEEKAQLRDLNYTWGLLHKKMGDAKMAKNQKEVDRLKSEILNLYIEKEQLMSQIRERQRQNDGQER